jgi:hypothetical protein
MTDDEKEWIDNASYEDLLRKWRHAPAESPWFRGETGAYFAAVMAVKRSELPDHGVSASKRIGW